MNLQRFRFALYKSTAKFHKHKAKFRLNAPKPHSKPYFLTSHLPFLHSGQFSRSLYSGQYPYTALKIGRIPTAHHQLSHTKPKAIVHNFDNFLETYSNKTYNPTNTISVFLPNHIAGIDVLLNVFGSGGTLVIPKSRNPQDILCAMQNYKVEILPTSPTLLRLLLMSEIEQFDLSALKLVVYGSEKMPDSLLYALSQKMPNVRFKQSFGTSETNAIKTKSLPNSDYFKFVNTDYKIIDNELYLKSKTQTLGYLNADNSAFDKEGYFATGDLVEILNINGEEYLRILGRTKEVINVGGKKVLPQEVENVILELPFIKDCLVYGESNAITGQSVGVKIVENNAECKNNIKLKKQIRLFCKDKLAPFKIPSKVQIVENLAITERFKKVRKGTT